MVGRSVVAGSGDAAGRSTVAGSGDVVGRSVVAGSGDVAGNGDAAAPRHQCSVFAALLSQQGSAFAAFQVYLWDKAWVAQYTRLCRLLSIQDSTVNLAKEICKITFSKFSVKSLLAKPLSDHLSDLTTHSWQCTRTAYAHQVWGRYRPSQSPHSHRSPSEWF